MSRPQKPPETGLEAAIERGRSAHQAWTKDGTLVSAAAFARSRGCSAEELLTQETTGELFSLVLEGERWYPAQLLKMSATDAAAVCWALAEEGEARKLVFLQRRHGALGGVDVAEAIARGDLARVLELAKASRGV